MTGVISVPIIIWAFLGGIIPTILWFFFWVVEDSRPEPTKTLSLAFMGGIISAIVLLLLQSVLMISGDGFKSVIYYAGLEEIAKGCVVFLLVAFAHTTTEPNDYMLLFITGGLGFAAFENILYIINPILENQGIFPIVMSGGFRFLGATLLHATMGAVVGIFLGVVFKKKLLMRIMMMFLGIACASIIHAFFNYLVLKEKPFFFIMGMFITWICVGIALYFLQKFHKEFQKNHGQNQEYILDQA